MNPAEQKPMAGANWSDPPLLVAAAIRKAFPSYAVTVRHDLRPPRFEAVAVDDSYPYCLISADAEEIWAALMSSTRTH
jgi:hypothetical protein